MARYKESLFEDDEPRLVVFSGAGLSADSGLDTFRNGSGSIWSKADMNVVCNILTFKRNFDKVHEFFNAFRAEVAAKEPNAMHRLVAQWETRYRLINLTQNVDDLLERAGCRDVFHLHGEIGKMECVACGSVWEIGSREWRAGEETCIKCPSKRGVKPGVVFFNQAAPAYRYMYDVFASLRQQDVLLVIGTSGQVIEIFEHARRWPCHKIASLLEEDLSNPSLRDFITIAGPAAQNVEAIDRAVTAAMSAPREVIPD